MKKAKQPLYRPQSAIDVLDLPLIGQILKHRWGRLFIQVPLLMIAILLIIDGFTGPQQASRNLATVAPWVHYRGIIVIVLLLAGNFFCMGCPFTLPRTLAKRLSIRGKQFPRILRNKWLAIGGLFVLFFLYEWLDLWSSPLLTAWVIVAYFVSSFVLEALFTESAFCKYVCPLGSFNFVYSTLSPTQISIKNADVCRTCVGKECINGSYAPQPVIRIDQIGGGESKTVEHNPQGTPGCGTLLFAPQIKSNLDCTLCLDCVRACPHENIGLFARQPGRELGLEGSWSGRWDISFLLIILVFMGITNAFGMVPPIFELQQWLVDSVGVQSEWLILLLIFGVGNLILPLVITWVVAWLSRFFTNTARKFSLQQIIATFAPAFVPLGFGIWAAHYGFHFLIAPLSIIPVVQEFLGQDGQWERYTVGLDLGIIGILQIILLVGGFLWSMQLAQKAALRLYRRQGMIGLMPWAVYLLLLMLTAIQIMSLPMEMRGTDFLFD